MPEHDRILEWARGISAPPTPEGMSPGKARLLAHGSYVPAMVDEDAPEPPLNLPITDGGIGSYYEEHPGDDDAIREYRKLLRDWNHAQVGQFMAGTYDLDLEVEKRKQKLLISARRAAQREVDEEERARAASTAEVVERVLTGDSILDQPEYPDAVWGKDARIGWAVGQATMIAAPQALGKSTIAQQLAMRRIGVRTDDFLGLPVALSDRPVLYLAMDRPAQITQSMRRMVTEQNRALLRDKLVIWPGPLPFNVVTDYVRLAEWVQQIAPGCQTVIFDSVKDIAPGISKDEVGAAINLAWQELLVNGVEVLSVHHHRKNGQGSEKIHTLDEVYGSTWLTSGQGSVFTIDGKPGEALVTLKHLKSVVEMLEDLEILHDFATGTSTLNNVTPPTIIEALDRAGLAGITVEAAARAMYNSTTQRDKQRVARALRALETTGGSAKLPRPAGASAIEPDRWFKPAQAAPSPQGLNLAALSATAKSR